MKTTKIKSFKNETFNFTSWSLKFSGTAALIAVLSVVGQRAVLLDFQLVILLLALSVLIALSAIVLGLIGTLRAIKAKHPDITETLAGSTLALLVIIPVLMTVLTGAGAPQIHDITTDLVDPPEFLAVKTLRIGEHNPLDRLTPENLANLQKESYSDLDSIILDRPFDRVFEQAVTLVKKRGWEVLAVSTANGRIEATDTTAIMGFKDDVVIRIRAEGKKSRVDMRSASRVGKGDWGVNAARIRLFLSELKQ